MNKDLALEIRVKRESCCSQVSVNHGRDGLQGMTQISRSSDSAFIKLAQKESVLNREEQDDATETPADFGFVVVDVNHAPWSEEGQTPEVDPLQLSSPSIKEEPPLSAQETLFVDIKREPESPGLPGDTEMFSSSVSYGSHRELNTSIDVKCEAQDLETATDVTSRVNAEGKDSTEPILQSSVADFDPNTSIDIKCEAQDLETATDVTSRVNAEGKDTTVSSEGRPRGRDSSILMTTLMRAERSKHDPSRENSAMEVPAKHNKPTREKRFNCDICKAMFRHKSLLARHITSHTGAKPHACGLCRSRYSQKCHLTAHMRIHAGLKPHVCEVCEARFTTKPQLTVHVRVHTGEKPYACYACEARFSQNSTLTAHMRSHTGAKPYACERCHASFSQKSNLTAHMRSHTGVKPHACDLCKARFSFKADLKRHIRTHMRAKPYVCGICQASFPDSLILTTHMRAHTEVKPFACEILHQTRLSNNSTLNGHMRTYTAMKRHVCNVCAGRFSCESSLTSHKQVQHEARTLLS